MKRFFKLAESNTTVGIELSAGLTTFMAMAYIVFVNPQMMASAGMEQGASFVATCLAAALACFMMGLYANWPVGLAPGMGLNAFFTYTIVGELGYPWQTALGAVSSQAFCSWYSLSLDSANGCWSASRGTSALRWGPVSDCLSA